MIRMKGDHDARAPNSSLSRTACRTRVPYSCRLDQGSGKVINLASQAASVSLLAHSASCASKLGLVGLTKVWLPNGSAVATWPTRSARPRS